MDGAGSAPSPDTRALASPRLAGTRLWASSFLARDEQRALEEAVQSSRSVGAGIDLAREGERTDTLFIMVEGWACRYSTTSDGGRQFPALLVPGDVANLDSLLFDRLDYGVRTLTRATVLTLPRERVLALAAQHPGIARTFTWLALVENAILGKWALSLGRRSAKERLAHLLCELAVRIHGEDRVGKDFDFPLTQEQIADALGLTSVHVNRTMQQLRNDGLVETEGRKMTLLDLAALRRIGGFDPRYLHLEGAKAPSVQEMHKAMA